LPVTATLIVGGILPVTTTSMVSRYVEFAGNHRVN